MENTAEGRSIDWSKMRVGLVLTGGGGKGAYEIGVWRALLNSWITRFSAISGTSIGGLNGYLIARGDLDRAEQLWFDLGKSSPLKHSLLRLVLGFLERTGLAIAYAIMTYVFLPGVGAVAVISLVLLILALHAFGGGLIFLAWPALPVFAMLWVLWCERMLRRTRLGRITIAGAGPYVARDHRRMLLFSFEPWISWIFALLGLLVVPAFPLIQDVGMANRSILWLVIAFVPPVLALILVWLSLDLGVSSMSQIPIFDGGCLEKELGQLLKEDSRKDDAGVSRVDLASELYVSRLVERGISLPGGTPVTAMGLEYVPLRQAEASKVSEVLRATGAIAGFLPRVYETAKKFSFTVTGLPGIYYDAGLIDNTPIAPLLEFHVCDVIIVVLLDSKITKPLDYLKEHIESVNRRLRNANSDLTNDVIEALGYFRFLTPVRVSSDTFKDVELITIVPSESLGNFLRGTLRFNAQRIEELMTVGENDADAAITAFTTQRLGASRESRRQT